MLQYLRRSLSLRRKKKQQRNSWKRLFDDPLIIIGFYHYDNLTDCERVCDLSCEVTHVVYNDEHERKQYTCRKRKPSRTSSFSNLATKGSFTFLFVAAVVSFKRRHFEIVQLSAFIIYFWNITTLIFFLE